MSRGACGALVLAALAGFPNLGTLRAADIPTLERTNAPAPAATRWNVREAGAAGATNLTAELAPQSGAEPVTLRLVCAGWTPARLNAASRDERVLGISLFAVTVRAEGAGTRVFEANTGQWSAPDANPGAPQVTR